MVKYKSADMYVGLPKKFQVSDFLKHSVEMLTHRNFCFAKEFCISASLLTLNVNDLYIIYLHNLQFKLFLVLQYDDLCE